MKEWLTAQELARECLPHLPSTKRGINDFASREGWNEHPTFVRPRAGRGGGMEYHIRVLPTLAMLEYQRRYMRVGIVDLPAAANDEDGPVAPAATPGADTPTARAARERDARLAVVKHFEKFERGIALNRQACLELFVTNYNARKLHVDEWVLAHVEKVSARSISRWLKAKKAGAALGFDRAKARKGKGVLDVANGGEVKDFILGLIAYQPHCSADHIEEQLQKRFGRTLTIVRNGVETPVKYPARRSLQRFVSILKDENKVLLVQKTNPDLYRSRYKLRGRGTLSHVSEPNQLWQIDASPVDALCTDGRWSVYVCIDIATRRVILYLSRTPKAAAVGLLIRKAILEWGAPQEIKIDNGSDFKAKATERLFAALDIDVEYSAPYSPEQKGFVERVIGTFQRQAVTLIPGFVGHSVSDRKAIEARKSFAKRLGEDDANTFWVQYNGDEMQVLVDDWARLKYQHRPHRGLNGRTPFEVTNASGYVPKTVDVRALDMLLAPAPDAKGYRVYGESGFQVGRQFFTNPEILHGTRAFIRRDPHDMGVIYAFGQEDGDFIGMAKCAAMQGIPPEAFMKAEKAEAAAFMKEKGRSLDAHMRAFASGPALIENAREIWLENQPKVTPFPRQTTPHSTPAIAAALDASQNSRKAPEAAKLSASASDIHARMKAEAAASQASDAAVAAPRTATVTKLDTAATRFRRALEIEAAIDAGADIAPSDLLWLGGYRQGSEYQSLKDMHEDFGDRMKL